MLSAVLLLVAAPYSFIDRTAELGLSIPGDGACWFDIDNDDYPDLVAGGAIWRNMRGKGFQKVRDIGAAVAADFDNDGYADLFSYSQMKLYRNNEGQGFEPFPLPTLPPSVSRGACWGDLDGDGFADLYVGGYEDWDKNITYPSLILYNEKGKEFKLVWQDATYRTRGVTACDFDRDGVLDVYVSNYRLQPNRLMRSDVKGGFVDVASKYNVVATSTGFEGGHSIGAAWGDFDEDGEIDLFAGNFAHVDSRGDQPKSRFLRNFGPKAGFKFEDLGTCGVFYQESYASPAAGDFDNDGRLDLFFTTVYPTASFGRKNFPVLFRNGGKFAFADVTINAGLSELPATYQAAWADFDRDGDLDLVSAGRLYVNQGGSNSWIEVHLEGDGKAVNRSAIGAQVRIKVGDKILTRQVEAGTGEGNQNELTLHFGLGDRKAPVYLQILWPNGKPQTVKSAPVRRLTTVIYRQKPPK